MDGGKTITTPAEGSGSRRFFFAALAAMSLLIADILLYPDTITNEGPHVLGIRVSPMKVFLVLTAPIIIAYVLKNRHKLRFQAIDIVLGATFTYVLLRGAIGAQSTTVMGMVAAYTGYAATIYYGFAVMGQKATARKFIVGMLIALGIGIAVYAIAEFYIGHSIYDGLTEDLVHTDSSRDFHRSSSTLGHPLVLALMLIQIAPFLVYFYIREKETLRKGLWLLSLAVFSVALTVTMSRGPWLTAAGLVVVAAAWSLWRYKAYRKRIAVLLISVLLVVGIFAIFNYDTLTAGTMSRIRKSESLAPRLYMWERVPAVFLDHPLFGVGMLQGGPEVSLVDPGPYTKIPIAVDNIYLTTLSDEGIVGTALMCGTLVMLGLQIYRLVRRRGTVAAITAALAFGMAGVMVEGFTFDSMLFWANMVIFWLAAGALRALSEVAERNEPDMKDYQ